MPDSHMPSKSCLWGPRKIFKMSCKSCLIKCSNPTQATPYQFPLLDLTNAWGSAVLQ